MTAENQAWYEELRRRYRPSQTEIVFLGESAPDPGEGQRRFFYAPELRADNLFRGLMLTLYDAGRDQVAGCKKFWLERFQRDGFWLLDVSLKPVNKLPSSERSRVLRHEAPGAVERIREADPRVGVVVCHTRAFEAAAGPIRAAGIRLLPDRPLPFPLGNRRHQFVAGVRASLALAGIKAPLGEN